MDTQVDYTNVNNYTNDLNNFLAENSEQFVNGDRTFNQWTNKFSDACESKQRLNLATKPMEYFVNSLNNISGTTEENFLSFTPIGNASQQNIANTFDRPIPSTLLTTSSVYTLPYLTSPNLQATNNINTLDTDTDLMLKTGLGLRNKNNRADLSEKRFPNYGDIHDMGVTVQNAGQFNKSKSKINPKLPPGLNIDINYENNTQGIGILPLGGPNGFGIDTYNMNLNLQHGPFQSCPDYMKNPHNRNNNKGIIIR
jgi:hypothetical protein